jgi:hypothetical protein
MANELIPLFKHAHDNIIVAHNCLISLREALHIGELVDKDNECADAVMKAKSTIADALWGVEDNMDVFSINMRGKMSTVNLMISGMVTAFKNVMKSDNNNTKRKELNKAISFAEKLKELWGEAHGYVVEKSHPVNERANRLRGGSRKRRTNRKRSHRKRRTHRK